MRRLSVLLKVAVLFFIVLGFGFYFLNNNQQLKEQLGEKKEQLEIAVMANKLIKADSVENFERIIEDNSKLLNNLIEKSYLSDADLSKLQQLLSHWKQTGVDFEQEKKQQLLAYLKTKLSREDYLRAEQLLSKERIDFKTIEELYLIWKQNQLN